MGWTTTTVLANRHEVPCCALHQPCKHIIIGRARNTNWLFVQTFYLGLTVNESLFRGNYSRVKKENKLHLIKYLLYGAILSQLLFNNRIKQLRCPFPCFPFCNTSHYSYLTIKSLALWIVYFILLLHLHLYLLHLTIRRCINGWEINGVHITSNDNHKGYSTTLHTDHTL